MTTRRPNFDAGLDRLEAVDLRDPYPARSAILRDIDQRQWALLAGYGAPERVNSVYWAVASGASDTWNCGLRVPPTVTVVRIGILAAGNGVVTMTSADDSTGIELEVQTRPSDNVDIEHAEWLQTSSDDTPTTADTRRALTVASSQALTWADTTLTVTLDADTGEDLQVYGYSLHYVWSTYDDDAGVTGAFSSGFSNGFS